VWTDRPLPRPRHRLVSTARDVWGWVDAHERGWDDMAEVVNLAAEQAPTSTPPALAALPGTALIGSVSVDR
jgi:hypothetical protein